MSNDSLLVWNQPNEVRSGAACLMVGLAELGLGTPSPEWEDEIFRMARSANGTGTDPAQLASYARGYGLTTGLWDDPDRRQGALVAARGHGEGPAGAFPEREGQPAIERLSAAGITFYRMSMHPNSFRFLLRSAFRMLVLLGRLDAEKTLHAHYSLIREVRDQVAVMDPGLEACGKNHLVEEDRLDAYLQDSRFLGITVFFKRPGETL